MQIKLSQGFVSAPGSRPVAKLAEWSTVENKRGCVVICGPDGIKIWKFKELKTGQAVAELLQDIIRAEAFNFNMDFEV